MEYFKKYSSADIYYQQCLRDGNGKKIQDNGGS